MGDVFKEQLVRKQPSVKTAALRVGIIAAAAVIVFIAVALAAQIGIILAFAICFGAYYLLTFLNVEYEYIFTNGELDIDIIYSRSRRKRLFSANVKNFDIMCHIEDKMRAGEFNGAQITLDYSGGTVTENTYAFLLPYKGKRTKVIIDPNEKMLTAIAGVMSRQKLFIKK